MWVRFRHKDVKYDLSVICLLDLKLKKTSKLILVSLLYLLKVRNIEIN